MPQSIDDVKRWMRDFHKGHLVSIRQIFKDYVCDGCATSLVDLAEVFTGARIGMPGYTICRECKENCRFGVPNRCDCSKWRMFQGGCDGVEKCVPFDLVHGWHRNVTDDEDLCEYHAPKILESEDPEQHKWRGLFKRVTVDDLMLLKLDDDTQVYHHRHGRGGAFIVTEIPNLVLPAAIPNGRLIEVCENWFGINEESADDTASVQEEYGDSSESSASSTDGETGSCVVLKKKIPCEVKGEDTEESYGKEHLSTPWTELVHLNGTLGCCWDSAILVNDDRISNIAEWVPFDQYTDGVMGCYGGFAIVNCNPDSQSYNQVATLIVDDHGRVAVDMAEMTLAEYLEARERHREPVARDPEAIHYGFRCDACHSRDIQGRRWNCSKCEVWDLCEACYTKQGSAGHCGDASALVAVEAPKMHFIESLRRKLGQGFYYG
jgi:hypothetical protein